MTDERLIEEARTGDFEDRGWMIDIIGRLANALVAAKRVHTPTDDELHALADVIEHVQTTWEADRERHTEPLAEFTARGILAAGFRRSEVPEPSAALAAIERAKAFLTDARETSEMRNRNAYGALKDISAEPSAGREG